MEYLNRTQQSWGNGNDEELEYINIFIQKAKVLIISNIDFIQFKDYQAQLLLNIINNRNIYRQSTITVVPKLNSLVGSGTFFTRMKEIFGKDVLH
jgi:DNA replication protein DnaC